MGIWHYVLRIRRKGIRGSIRLLIRLTRDAAGKMGEKAEFILHPRCLSDKAFLRKVNIGLPDFGDVRAALARNDLEGVKGCLVRAMGERRKPKFFWEASEKKSLLTLAEEGWKEEKTATVKKAEDICEHNFEFVVPGATFCGNVDWLSNLGDGRSWEIRYWRDIDYSSAKRIGDVRLIWELNRHQYFITLGKAYWYTEDEKYANEFVWQIKDWIEKNPYGKSVNWVHAQEVALRIISWIWAYYFFCKSPSFSPEDQVRFLKSLYEQTEFLRKHLSDTAELTHNHIISETAGLGMMAIMFPEFKKSKRWWKDGVERLEKELKRQICNDGVSGETSTNYHFFVLDSFLQVWILLKKNGCQYSSEMGQMLEKMIEFAMYICRPDGTLPIIGDSDSGRAIRLDDLNDDDRRSYLSTGAVLFDRSDMKRVAGKFHEESLWLLGSEGYRKFREINSCNPEKLSILYPDSGFCAMRSDWGERASQLIFRGGVVRIPKDVSMGHNHADYLSFELIIDGKPFIVDPGVYAYNLDDEWRWYARKTSSHNTVVVDNADQFVVDSQRFGLRKIAAATVHAFQSEDSIGHVRASHDGYRTLNDPITHQREIYFHKIGRCWTITDVLAGKDMHKFEWHFHFDVGMKAKLLEKSVAVVRSREGMELSIRPLEQKGLTAEIIEGWVSKRYGIKERADVLRYSIESECPCELQIEIRS